jgi:glycine cleavage system regulatory protein
MIKQQISSSIRNDILVEMRTTREKNGQQSRSTMWMKLQSAYWA